MCVCVCEHLSRSPGCNNVHAQINELFCPDDLRFNELADYAGGPRRVYKCKVRTYSLMYERQLPKLSQRNVLKKKMKTHNVVRQEFKKC